MEQIVTVERKDTGCVKWDGLQQLYGDANLISMWVADMDFECPLSVKKAMQQQAEHNVYGYGLVSDSYYQAFMDWEENVHGYPVQREWLLSLPGVVVGFFWAIQAFTKPQDACMILTPLYGPFQNSIRTTGRTLVESKLIQENGVYQMDFDDIEKKMKEEQVKLMFFCSPHNPVGRVWTKEEVERIVALCRKYEILLVSDEIHQDIIPSGKLQIPTATVSDYQKLMTLTAPSKTFNLAGCQNAFAIIEDAALRKAFQDYCATIGIVHENNIFGYLAAEAAYRDGYDWLQSLNAMILKNFCLLRDQLMEGAPKLVISPLEGTYLAWVDFGAYLSAEEQKEFFVKECGIAVNYGDAFTVEPGDTHVRLNLATSTERVQETADRILTALRARK